MAADPSSITKFRALHALDKFLGDPDPATRERNQAAALERLDDPNFDITGTTVAGIEEIANGANAAPAPLRHLDEHWLSGRFFPGVDAGHIKDTIRTGFRAAIAEAHEKKLPLNAVWVCGSDDAGAKVFRVDHVAGPTCVTVAIITPKPA
jgi:hypothetical protein